MISRVRPVRSPTDALLLHAEGKRESERGVGRGGERDDAPVSDGHGEKMRNIAGGPARLTARIDGHPHLLA